MVIDYNKGYRLKEVVQSIMGYGTNFILQGLDFDSIQTHYISPVNKQDVPRIKKELRKYNINKFRQVKLNNQYVI